MEEFVKPADLFKKRRISGALSSSFTTINTSTSNNNSNSNKTSCNTASTTISPFMSAVTSMRPKSKLVAQSPMKCLSNLTDPSPTKKLPVVLKNPFNQRPVKRRLQLGDSPMKRHLGSAPTSSSTSSSPRKSPVKKSSRMFEMNDEDANLEPPKMKHQLRTLSPVKRHHNHRHNNNSTSASSCFQNDWTLKSKLLVTFPNRCKNWSLSSTTTHKRHSGNLMDEDTPSKVNDRTISMEAIKNAATYYQHPYLPWLTLFPRKVNDKTAIISNNDQEKKQAQFAMSKHPAAIKAMLKAWCESLDDITNLLLDGKCPFFYLCSDFKTMLFKRSTSYHDVQIFITPFNLDFGLTLTKHGIDYKSDISDDLENNNNNENTNSCNSQQMMMFGSFNSNTMLDSQLSSFSMMNSQQRHSLNRNKSFNESNNPYSNIDEELGLDDDDDDENEQTSEAIFESIGIKGGWSELDAKKPDTKLAGSVEVNSSNLINSSKSIGVVEGVENVRKFIKLMQTNKTHTINNIGEFASIPPTIISPREFRLSTPQYPEVVIIKSKDFNKITTSSSSLSVAATATIIGTPNTQSSQSTADELQTLDSNKESDVRVRILTQSSSNFDEGIQDDISQSSLMATETTTTTTSNKQISSITKAHQPNTIVVGPGSFELQGPILPSLYRKLHKLLLVSDNSNHICSATQLSSSVPFGLLRFPLSH